jgi:hypothetical protein
METIIHLLLLSLVLALLILLLQLLLLNIFIKFFFLEKPDVTLSMVHPFPPYQFIVCLYLEIVMSIVIEDKEEYCHLELLKLLWN